MRSRFSAGPLPAEGRITRWREDTRGQRMKIADEAMSEVEWLRAEGPSL